MIFSHVLYQLSYPATTGAGPLTVLPQAAPLGPYAGQEY
jgi:hypothetical protein